MRYQYLLFVPYLLLWQPMPVWGWGASTPETKNRVVLVENVKLDYAQVLNVEPVYQTLRASRAEEQCEPESEQAPQSAPETPKPSEDGRFSRMLESVKEIFTGHQDAEEAATAPAPAPVTAPRNCKVVAVPREFRRPIAYDVDYVYKGTKYRSRLPDDPGNRLRIRVSVTPYIPDAVVVPPR